MGRVRRGRKAVVAQEELQDKLQSIDGVASAEVDLIEGEPPVARVFLDGSRDPDEVRETVNALLGSAVPVRERPQPRRRGGLGRGLGEVITSDAAQPAPAHIDTAPRPVASRISRVGIVESEAGVVAEIEDALGNTESITVGPDGSIDRAVADGVRRLLGVPASTYIAIKDLDTGQGSLVVAAVTSDDDRRSAGAAFVEYGRPWATANAVMQALSGL